MRLRNEDFANWGAYVLEDIGIVEVDRAIESISSFGESIRQELCSPAGILNAKWTEVALRLYVLSPSTTNPNAMLASLCQLSAALLFTEGRHAPTRYRTTS